MTQAEADALIAMPKLRVNDNEVDYPELGGYVSVPLIAENRKEGFLLDIRRSRIDLLKCTYQNRARQVVILVRLDLAGAPHRNPDGQEIECPHLHLYREGFGDKWAFAIPPEIFSNPTNSWASLENFMRYCNIISPPSIRRGLFT